MRILLSTIGTYGDLFPLLGVAAALRVRGASVVFATQPDHLEMVRAAGFPAISVYPSVEDLARQLDQSPEEIVRRTFDEVHYLYRVLLPAGLEEGAAALRSEMRDVDLAAGTFQSMAARIAAEAADVPFVPLYLQPAPLMAPEDPPLVPGAGVLALRPGALGLVWNRAMLALARGVMRVLYAGPVNGARRAEGLGPLRAAPYFGGQGAERLCLYPALMQRRAVPGTVYAGFVRHHPQAEALDPEMEGFLANGPPPIVFTLGSAAGFLDADFYAESRKAAAAIGCRAVLLTGRPDETAHQAEDVAIRGYLPHHAIFPRTAAIVHHGGIGTTAEALAAGRPQLIVPQGADQPDNGDRLRRLGVARVVPGRRYGAERAARVLDDLLSDDRIAATARRIAQAPGLDGGGDRAAAALLRMAPARGGGGPNEG